MIGLASDLSIFCLHPSLVVTPQNETDRHDDNCGVDACKRSKLSVYTGSLWIQMLIIWKSSMGDASPGFDAHKGKVAAMAQQRPSS